MKRFRFSKHAVQLPIIGPIKTYLVSDRSTQSIFPSPNVANTSSMSPEHLAVKDTMTKPKPETGPSIPSKRQTMQTSVVSSQGYKIFFFSLFFSTALNNHSYHHRLPVGQICLLLQSSRMSVALLNKTLNCHILAVQIKLLSVLYKIERKH